MIKLETVIQVNEFQDFFQQEKNRLKITTYIYITLSVITGILSFFFWYLFLLPFVFIGLIYYEKQKQERTYHFIDFLEHIAKEDEPIQHFKSVQQTQQQLFKQAFEQINDDEYRIRNRKFLDKKKHKQHSININIVTRLLVFCTT